MRNKESLFLMICEMSVSRPGCKSPSSSPSGFTRQLVCILLAEEGEESSCIVRTEGMCLSPHPGRLCELGEAFSVGDTNNP